MKGVRKIVAGVGDPGQGEHSVLEAFNGAPGDIHLTKVSECLAEKLKFAWHRSTGFRDCFDERGKVLRGHEIGVGVTQTEMGFD